MVRTTASSAGFSAEPLNTTSKKPQKALTGPPSDTCMIKSSFMGACKQWGGI